MTYTHASAVIWQPGRYGKSHLRACIWFILWSERATDADMIQAIELLYILVPELPRPEPNHG